MDNVYAMWLDPNEGLPRSLISINLSQFSRIIWVVIREKRGKGKKGRKGRRESWREGERNSAIQYPLPILFMVSVIPSANPGPNYMLLFLFFWVQGSTQQFAKVRRGLWLVQNNDNSICYGLCLPGVYILQEGMSVFSLTYPQHLAQCLSQIVPNLLLKACWKVFGEEYGQVEGCGCLK